MAKGGNQKQYTEEYFLNLGYTKLPDGSFAPPKFKNPLTHLTPDKIEYKRKSVELVDIIQKEKVVETINFEVKPVTEWFIPYQVPSKKNSRQNFTTKTGKQISIPSKRHKDYISATKRYWEVFGIEFNQTLRKLNLNWPVNIEMTFTRTTNQVVDFFGPGETVFDCMTDFKWWPDDSHRFGKPFFGDIIVDKTKPGVKIKLLVK